MLRKTPRTLVVVADGARARFFMANEDGKGFISARTADMVAPESRSRSRDLKSDKPGRGYSSSRGGMRHALEPPHDYHKLEKHRFTADLVEALDEACGKREFDRLVLVAPRRSLGELRSLLPVRVQSRVTREVPKDLTNETPAALWRRLGTLVRAIV